jgi:hypothetical protein
MRGIRMNRKSFSVALVLLVLMGWCAPSGSSAQSSIVVQNSNDSGPGSLRQAIADAPSGAVITFRTPYLWENAMTP